MLISSKGILTFGLAALAALCLCFVPASAQIVRERGADAGRESIFLSAGADGGGVAQG